MIKRARLSSLTAEALKKYSRRISVCSQASMVALTLLDIFSMNRRQRLFIVHAPSVEGSLHYLMNALRRGDVIADLADGSTLHPQEYNFPHLSASSLYGYPVYGTFCFSHMLAFP